MKFAFELQKHKRQVEYENRLLAIQEQQINQNQYNQQLQQQRQTQILLQQQQNNNLYQMNQNLQQLNNNTSPTYGPIW